ncbi:hypothetical protein H5410_002395, partial [Solanum commersonii]
YLGRICARLNLVVTLPWEENDSEQIDQMEDPHGIRVWTL